jgi:hypothetical protein
VIRVPLCSPLTDSSPINARPAWCRIPRDPSSCRILGTRPVFVPDPRDPSSCRINGARTGRPLRPGSARRRRIRRELPARSGARADPLTRVAPASTRERIRFAMRSLRQSAGARSGTSRASNGIVPRLTTAPPDAARDFAGVPFRAPCDERRCARTAARLRRAPACRCTRKAAERVGAGRWRCRSARAMQAGSCANFAEQEALDLFEVAHREAYARPSCRGRQNGRAATARAETRPGSSAPSPTPAAGARERSGGSEMYGHWPRAARGGRFRYERHSRQAIAKGAVPSRTALPPAHWAAVARPT